MQNRGPLGHVELQILLNLASSPSHGYALMQAISQLSGGRLKAGPGTLYVALKRMMAAGLVTTCDPSARDSRSRRDYQITPAGIELLKDELLRLSEIVDQATLGGWLTAR